MPTYYVDPAASGDNDGTTWANAWQTLQRAIDGTDGTQPVAGDIVYCRGTETLAASIDVDGNEGSAAAGMIKYIGCNASGNNDGTRYVIDGDGAAANCLTANARDWHYFENFEFTGATDDGVEGSAACYDWFFYNCSFHANGAQGLNAYNLRATYIVRCAAYLNTGADGFYISYDSKIIFSSSHDNTGSGIYMNGSMDTLIGCLFYDNGDDGIEGIPIDTLVFNCVSEVNTDDGIHCRGGGSNVLVLGSRITNHSGGGQIGLNCSGEVVIHGWNYFENNDGDNIQNDTLAIELLDAGVGTNDEDNADTNEGYTSKTDGSEDFNLRSDASLRRTAITIPTS